MLAAAAQGGFCILGNHLASMSMSLLLCYLLQMSHLRLLCPCRHQWSLIL